MVEHNRISVERVVTVFMVMKMVVYVAETEYFVAHKEKKTALGFMCTIRQIRIISYNMR